MLFVKEELSEDLDKLHEALFTCPSHCFNNLQNEVGIAVSETSSVQAVFQTIRGRKFI